NRTPNRVQRTRGPNAKLSKSVDIPGFRLAETSGGDASVHQIDVEDRQFENVRPAAFFDFQKQHGDEFFADINFERVCFLRTRDDANFLVVEFISQVSIES